MTIEPWDWQEERERLRRVLDEIDRKAEMAEAFGNRKRSELQEARKSFGDEARLNFAGAGEIAETFRSLKQQAETVAEKERDFEKAASERDALRRMKRSPYFGRVDFRENGLPTERIYIGIGSVRDSEELEFLVYDWRAPISSLYYDGLPGPASFEAPAGPVTGALERKRQYLIRDGELEGMFDTSETIGDELLQEVLGKQAEDHMKTIVATIQKEQNRIIRDTSADVLIVQGAAGSGKTSAALQRIAYLLYRYRGRLHSNQVVLFSPNPLFASYVSAVLPELGERNMRQTTFETSAEERLAGAFALESSLDQLEFVLSRPRGPEIDVRTEGIAFKSGLAFVKALEAYGERLRGGGIVFRDVVFRGEPIVAAETIAAKFASIDASIRLPNRVALLGEWLLEEAKRAVEEEKGKEWVEEESGRLGTEAYAETFRRMLAQKRLSGETFDDYERERELLAERVVQTYFAETRASIRRMRFIDYAATYRRLFEDAELVGRLLPESASPPPHWPHICAWTLARLDAGELPFEDAAPFLLLKEAIDGGGIDNTAKHVFVDEAQDVSPAQFALLRKWFPRCRFTILGDVNQTVHVHGGGAPDIAPLRPAESASAKVERIELKRTYRSTEPIVRFAQALLPDGSETTPFPRGGPLPVVEIVGDASRLAERIARRSEALRSRGRRTIAVVCKSAAESAAVHAELAGRADALLATKETSSFPAGLVVIPVYLAKGIEFDAVIVSDASGEAYATEHDRKLLYTACTRAMHELVVFAVGAPSPLLTGVPKRLYVVEPS